jgi:hypothetical protein
MSAADGTGPDSDATPALGGPEGAQPYGPNTTAVRRFLQRLAALPAEEWDAAAAEWAQAAGSVAVQRADRALQAVIERAGREGERDAALGPLLQLVRLPDPPGHGPDDPPPLAAVAEPAAAAVLALVARDLLPAAAFDALYAPFARRIPTAALDR